jgi:hypothetical protein
MVDVHERGLGAIANVRQAEGVADGGGAESDRDGQG